MPVVSSTASEVAESIERRARKMTAEPRERVIDEVAGRAFAFGVEAPVQDLTRLLIDATKTAEVGLVLVKE